MNPIIGVAKKEDREMILTTIQLIAEEMRAGAAAE